MRLATFKAGCQFWRHLPRESTLLIVLVNFASLLIPMDRVHILMQHRRHVILKRKSKRALPKAGRLTKLLVVRQGPLDGSVAVEVAETAILRIIPHENAVHGFNNLKTADTIHLRQPCLEGLRGRVKLESRGGQCRGFVRFLGPCNQLSIFRAIVDH